MTIVGLDVVRSNLPLIELQRMGEGGACNSQEVVFVRVRLDDGTAGHGEFSSWPLFSGATAAGAASLIEETLGAILVGADEREWRLLERRIDGAFPGVSGAKAACDMALLDALSRRYGMPLRVLVGGRSQFSIQPSYSVSLQQLDLEQEKVAEKYFKGYRIFKVKCGVLGSDEDIQRIRNIRKVAPDGRIRVDFNQAGSEDRLKALASISDDIDIEYVEQPFGVGQDDRLARARRWFKTPISLDESVTTPDDLLRACRADLLDVVSLKYGKFGTASRMLEAIDIARRYGLATYAGSFSETRLGVAASMQILSAADGLLDGGDFYFPLEVMDDTDVIAGRGSKHAKLTLPDSPGHGVSPRDSLVREFDRAVSR